MKDKAHKTISIKKHFKAITDGLAGKHGIDYTGAAFAFERILRVKDIWEKDSVFDDRSDVERKLDYICFLFGGAGWAK